CATHPGDKLDIYIGAVSSSNRWRSLCGTNLPVNLRTMNMRVPVLTIQFKSDNQTTAMENGFYLNYRIVSSHDASSESSSKYEPLSDEWKQKEYTLPAEKEANQSLNTKNSGALKKTGEIKRLPKEHKALDTSKTCRCNSPYHLEIITFQNLSTSLPQFTERGHGSREWKLKDYEDDSATSLAFKDFNWIAGDRIKLCFQRDSNEELKNKAFMSSQLPRVDVVLKASFDEWLNDRHSSLQLPEQGEFYSVDYNFVTG
ncbi:hypothetical protein T265_12948, partial [Opisthorchis viverrini]